LTFGIGRRGGFVPFLATTPYCFGIGTDSIGGIIGTGSIRRGSGGGSSRGKHKGFSFQILLVFRRIYNNSSSNIGLGGLYYYYFPILGGIGLDIHSIRW
jgi:hypothetical protein